MSITPEERKRMRNCAVFLGEPAATELVRVLDALAAAERSRDVLAKRLADENHAPCHDGDCPVPHLENTPRCQDGAPIDGCRADVTRCWIEFSAQEAQKRWEGK
jgi:hypothetical protein